MPSNPPLRSVDGAGRPLPSESDKTIAAAVKTFCDTVKSHSPAWVVCVATNDGTNSVNAAGGDPFIAMQMVSAAISATAATIEQKYEPPKGSI